jgi:hypothetical protein
VYGEALVRWHPDLRPGLPSTVRWLLAAQGGARGQLSVLARRYAAS